MINRMLNSGLRVPEFSQPGEFVVTFWRREVQTQAVIGEPGHNSQFEQTSQFRSPALASSSPRPVESGSREERLKMALEEVRQKGYITNKGYQKLTGVSENTATRDLEVLVERGSLTRTGKGPSRRYTL
jgi:predicted HTH transcriptional regulator